MEKFYYVKAAACGYFVPVEDDNFANFVSILYDRYGQEKICGRGHYKTSDDGTVSCLQLDYFIEKKYRYDKVASMHVYYKHPDDDADADLPFV